MPAMGPHVGHVSVAGEHDVDAALAKQGEHVACVEHLVALAAGPWNGDEVMVANEHAHVRFLRESVHDPAVVFATDFAFVKVGLGGIDGNQRDVDTAEFAVQA